MGSGIVEIDVWSTRWGLEIGDWGAGETGGLTLGDWGGEGGGEEEGEGEEGGSEGGHYWWLEGLRLRSGDGWEWK